MCIIVAKKSGVEVPSKIILEECDTYNPDGMGVGYRLPNGLIRIKKDFPTFEKFYEFVAKNITKDIDAIFHFRIATHGLVDYGNRHPFPITRNLKRMRQTDIIVDHMVAHNGVLSQYGMGTIYSDSQKFTAKVLAEPKVKAEIGRPEVQAIINNIIKTSKLAILTPTDFITIGNFTEDAGVLYSNVSYRPVPARHYGTWLNPSYNYENYNWNKGENNRS